MVELCFTGIILAICLIVGAKMYEYLQQGKLVKKEKSILTVLWFLGFVILIVSMASYLEVGGSYKAFFYLIIIASVPILILGPIMIHYLDKKKLGFNTIMAIICGVGLCVVSIWGLHVLANPQYTISAVGIGDQVIEFDKPVDGVSLSFEGDSVVVSTYQYQEAEEDSLFNQE